MKRVFLLFFFSFLLLSSVLTVHAGEAECDPCGFCGPDATKKPQNWGNCVKCMYDVEDPTTVDTKTVDAVGVFVTKPVKGNYYTQLGCIKTGVVTNPGQVFSNPTQVGGIVNYLLNKVIFPIVGALAFIYLIYGAFLLATSQDDYERKIEAQQTIKGAIFGLIFTLMSVFIVSFIAGDVLKIPGFTKGPTIKISMYGVRNGIDRDNLPEPLEPIAILKINGTEAKKFTIDGQNSYPAFTQESTQYKTYTYSHNTLIDLSKDKVSIVFPNDYCVGIGTCKAVSSKPIGNRDIFVQYIEINGKKCQEFQFTKGPYVFPRVLEMWWPGEAVCTSWES